MNPPARVTLVIPCFNDGATIVEAVESVQEDESVLVVVVDDGSTDGTTPGVLADLAARHEHVTIVTHEVNRGVPAGINSGSAAVTTPYIFYLGADDLVVPGAMAKLADTLDADDELAVTWGDYEFFGARTGYVTIPEFDLWQLTYVNRWTGVAMVRRTAFEQVGGIDDRSMYEDWDLWMSFAEAGLKCAPTVGVQAFKYRIHHQTLRRCAEANDRFPAEYRLLRELHPRLFAQRDQLRRTSRLSAAQRRREQVGLLLNLRMPKAGRRGILALGAIVRNVRQRGGAQPA